MRKFIWDLDDDDYIFSLSDRMAIDSDGNMMMRISDNMAMEMDSGDIHFVLSWEDESL